MSNDPTPRELGYYFALAQVGAEMALPALFGCWLDDWFGTTPWIVSIAAVVGFVAGLLHLIVLLKQKEREESSNKKPPS
jgi:F0F1-type ATP synthase assembly protein I